MPGRTDPTCRSALSPHPPHLLALPLALPLALSLALVAGIAHGAESAPADGVAAGDDVPVMQTITVTGSSDASAYTTRKSSSASKFDLSLRDTPQAVSVVTRAQMDDFKLDNASKVLAQTTGVTVEAVETDRTYYTARGYDITNFQFDGVGIPFVFGNVMGDLDTALFERVDIVRGANGLISSTGNPSATVNFVRKRPTQGLAAAAGVTLGSWNTRRVDADVSTPLGSDGKVAARFVAAHEEGDSHLDRYSPRKDVAYAIVEAKLTPDTRLAVGHSYQNNLARGGMWGALPVAYTDGTPTDYPISASTPTCPRRSAPTARWRPASLSSTKKAIPTWSATRRARMWPTPSSKRNSRPTPR